MSKIEIEVGKTYEGGSRPVEQRTVLAMGRGVYAPAMGDSFVKYRTNRLSASRSILYLNTASFRRWVKRVV